MLLSRDDHTRRVAEVTAISWRKTKFTGQLENLRTVGRDCRLPTKPTCLYLFSFCPSYNTCKETPTITSIVTTGQIVFWGCKGVHALNLLGACPGGWSQGNSEICWWIYPLALIQTLYALKFLNVHIRGLSWVWSQGDSELFWWIYQLAFIQTLH